ncbi:hypothetical protein ACFL3T_04710 [Patescibacteria group bacterium]
MDKKTFLQSEIEHVLKVIDYISPDERAELLSRIKDFKTEELEKLLKTLYKVERRYLEYKLNDVKDTEKFLNTFK